MLVHSFSNLLDTCHSPLASKSESTRTLGLEGLACRSCFCLIPTRSLSPSAFLSFAYSLGCSLGRSRSSNFDENKRVSGSLSPAPTSHQTGALLVAKVSNNNFPTLASLNSQTWTPIRRSIFIGKPELRGRHLLSTLPTIYYSLLSCN